EGAPPRLAALFDLRPHSASLPDPDDPGAQREHQWWVASDLGEDVTGRPLDEDHVLGIGGASLSLLGQTIRERVGSALDLGCGCGTQALYLATHCGRVVATDLSARAGALTQFNAALNGAPIDVRVGSLFEPVSGESFDLIVSNPPFVITPDTVRAGAGFHEYRDGGMQRDELVGALIRSAPDHLAPGGTLQILANWEIPAGADPDGHWSPRVEDWLSGLGVDAWVVQRDALDPAQYAEMWIRDSGGHRMSHEAFERGYAAWLRDFTAAGVGAIGMGFLAVRRPEPGEGERAPGGPDQGAGGGQWLPGGGRAAFDLALEGRAPRGVDVAWALRSLRAPRTWDLVLTRAPDVREERHYVPGSPDPCLLVLHQGAGLGRSVPVSPAVSAVVGASDGALTVGQIVAAVAALTDREADDVWEEARAPLAELIRWGFLTF
ncbi:methyltransferase, partial [Pauljensenia hongkongensis]|uniref:methyltransferase n=1 Tax=Pauljensenia hongkongensis TaxID=178339 RepID=UPI0001F66192